MLETNIRIVYPGKNLCVWVRHANVKGSDFSADLLEMACSKLRNHYKLAAVKCLGEPPTLLVATSRPIPTIRLEDDEWELEITDAAKDAHRLTLADPKGVELLPLLIERALMVKLAHYTNFWRISDSARVWYKPEPFRTEGRIDVYRRYRIAALPLGDRGVGVAVDPGTAFFTADALAYFFDPDVSLAEQESRSKLFNQLTDRQSGQKGTLLYDNSRSLTKCYFESAPPGITCATTGKVRAKGHSYDSLYDYYRAEYPKLEVDKDDQAIRVSFKNISKPQWIAAKQVRVRVMNDSLPKSLGSIDKIEPHLRRRLVQGFWKQLVPRPFGQVAPGPQKGFWRPGKNRVHQFSIPDLTFGRDEPLPAPSTCSTEAYRNNYRQRLEYLEEMGCYYVPPDMPRTLYFAYPSSVDAEVANQLATDLAQAIHNWTASAGCLVQAAKPIAYDSSSEAIAKLRKAERSGVVVFVLSNEPAAYYEVAFQLERWRVKRVTENVLREHYRYLKKGRWNKKKKILDPALGKRRWGDFVNLNALAVLQLLEAVPFRLDQADPYEAQLFVDVGHDRRHFALSLLIARNKDKDPSFHIISRAYIKTDPQQETINPKILAEQTVELFEAVLRRTSDPLQSLLVLRDGRFCREEYGGVDDAVKTLKDTGKLSEGARVDLADFRKDSLKAVRLWEIDDFTGTAKNPLEGQAVRLNDRVIVVASTGAATLHQGTAQPYMIVGNRRCSDVIDVAQATFAGAQLNWSSPRVAQRLPLQAKRADEDLKERAAQEIKRYH